MGGLDAEPAGTNRIQVLVRVRPPIGHEAKEELAVACSPSQEHVQVLVPERLGDKPQLPSHASLKGTAKKYTLDACLDGSVSQESVAVVCNVDDLVDGALQGFAVTVFAFGQTGS
ncbi:MAG: kinesin KIF12, partial [Trebouxia sp. A1-2]